MATPIIQANELGKAYRLGAKNELPDTTFAAIKGVLLAPLRNARRLRDLDTNRSSRIDADQLFWALKNVSFTIEQGEVVGVIGRNGAGKSTLLKILSRITSPTTGTATLDGRVSSLLEVGTGFHPDLTGRENIYMNGTILGMRKTEIDTKFDMIVDFSGVEAFLDTPIKRYSSGMQVRLAFAVAAHLEPEILIIDEVLAVGDAEFQKKCLGKMKAIAGSGRTVLFVSHNMHAIRTLTHRTILLDQGQVKCIADTPTAIDSYLSEATDNRDAPHAMDNYRPKIRADAPIQIRKIQLCDSRGDTTSLPRIASGENLKIGVEVEATTAIGGVYLTLSLNRDGEACVGTTFTGDSDLHLQLQPGVHIIECELTHLPLAPGRYLVSAGLNRSTASLAYDAVMDYPLFDVHIPALDRAEMGWPNRPWGVLDLSHARWNVRSGKIEP